MCGDFFVIVESFAIAISEVGDDQMLEPDFFGLVENFGEIGIGVILGIDYAVPLEVR